MKLVSGLAAFAGIICAGLLGEYLAERRDSRRYPAPGKMVPIDNRKMHLSFCGERRSEAPLVILECGMGSWSFYWRFVQPGTQFKKIS